MLEVRDLEVGYGESVVVQGASLRVDAGQVVAVLGRNGVGKTTLLRGIAGLTRPRAGRVLLRGDEITGLSAHAIATRGVRLVPQGRRLFSSLDVREHFVVGGRALTGHPDILLMDEPTEGLAPLLVRELARVLAELKREGVSILLVEQNLAFALRVADYVYLLSKGRTVHACAPEALRSDDAVKARYLGV